MLLMSSTALAQVAGGTLIVNVPNSPGEIMLDGFPTGQEAPATLENVAPGTHLVQMEFGCMVGEKQVTVTADKTTKLTLPMTYKGGTGTIRLKGVPYTATILVDDAPIRSWEEGVEAKCGSRRITVESPGFEDWSTNAIVTSGKWLTVQVSLVEAEIQETAPAPPRQSSRPVDDFEDDYDELDELDRAYADEGDDYDDYDEFDELDEPEPSSRSSRDKDRERELERRQQEQEERKRAEAERRRAEEQAKRDEEDRRRAEEERREREAIERRQAEEDARRQAEEDERRSRYGDIDSLDAEEEEEEPQSRRRTSTDDELDELEEEYDEFDEDDGGRSRRNYDDEEDFDDEFDDEDTDRFDDEDEYDELDELDEGSSGRDREPREPREPRAPREGSSLSGGKGLQLGGTAAAGAVALGGATFAIVSSVQYSAGRDNWNVIVDATGFGSEQEISYWDQYVQPYRNRAIAGAIIAGVGLAAAGTWFFVAPDGTVHVGISRRF